MTRVSDAWAYIGLCLSDELSGRLHFYAWCNWNSEGCEDGFLWRRDKATSDELDSLDGRMFCCVLANDQCHCIDLTRSAEQEQDERHLDTSSGESASSGWLTLVGLAPVD